MVTVKDTEAMLYGLTVSSFSSVSLDPPLVSVCIDNGNRFPSMVESCGRFAVSILGAEQQEASNYFARSGRLPTSGFTEIEGEWTPGGLPIVKGALAWLGCEVFQAVPAGDHTILLGRVVETHATAVEEPAPLLYYRRGYGTVTR